MNPTARTGNGLWLLPFGLVCFFVNGCGDGDDVVKTYPAQGEATFCGNPMPGALITLHPIDGEAKTRHLLPHGTVGEDGSYTLGTRRVGDGAPLGRYKVTINWSDEPDAGIISPNQVSDRLGGRYINAEKSTIEVTIEEGNNTLPPIDLH